MQILQNLPLNYIKNLWDTELIIDLAIFLNSLYFDHNQK